MFALILSFALLSPATASPFKHNLKNEKQKLHDAPGVTAYQAFVNLMLFADVPAPAAEPVIYETVLWPVPVNDAKPDNIAYQLIRQKQLKLHISNCDISC